MALYNYGGFVALRLNLVKVWYYFIRVRFYLLDDNPYSSSADRAPGKLQYQFTRSWLEPAESPVLSAPNRNRRTYHEGKH